MAPTSASAPDTIENNLQPFFVLHKASSRKSKKRSAGTGKTRRRIHLSPSPTNKNEKSEECVEQHLFKHLRMEAFELVWSKIDSTVKDVLRGINTNVFDEIRRWVCESFNTIKSFGTPGIAQATRAFPIVTDASSKLLFTGLVLTNNMEFVDDLLTFDVEAASLLQQQSTGQQQSIGCGMTCISYQDRLPSRVAQSALHQNCVPTQEQEQIQSSAAQLILHHQEETKRVVTMGLTRGIIEDLIESIPHYDQLINSMV